MSIKKRKFSLVYASKFPVAFKNDKPLHFMLAVYLCIFIVFSVKPVEIFEWWLENIISLIAIFIIAILYRKSRLTNASYVCIMILLILHSIGAHYTYALCPIGEWGRKFFSMNRNNYDRFMSFAFGYLVSFPVVEIMYHRFRLRYKQACVISCLIILAVCSIYEITQTYLALLLTSHQADVFIGMQNDLWDTQNDMFFGLIGATIAVSACIIAKMRSTKKIYRLNKEK